MIQFFANGRGRSVPRQQPIFKRQPKYMSPDRLQMSLIQRAGIRAANGSRKQRIADEADALRVSIHTIADPARGMARRGEAMDAETPDRNRLTMFRRLQLCRRGLPAEEIDILRSEIHRHLTKLQNLIDPIGVVRMAVRQTYPNQLQRGA